MTGAATAINTRMAPRGNKGMKTMTIYIEPDVLRKFKSICALENKSMTQVIHEYIKKIVKQNQG